VTSAGARIAVGVVGTGFAALAHLDALRRLPGVDVVAIAGSDRAHTLDVASRYGLRAYDDYRAMLSDERVQAIHNCTVNRLHYDVSLAALEQGKHVLSEKPLAVDSAQSARLAVASDRAAHDGVVAGVCFNYRHYPLVAQVREMIASRDYGSVHFVRGHYLQDWLLLRQDWNWRVDEAQDGSSRAVADIGSHWLDLVQHVTGDRVSEVLADLGTLHHSRLRPSRRVETFSNDGGPASDAVEVHSEDFGAVLVRFESGARGAFTLSQTTAGRKNGLRFEIDTTDATLAWDQERPDRVWVGRREGPNLEIVRDPGMLCSEAATLTRLPGGHPEGWFDALRNVLEDFYAAVAAPGDRAYRVADFRAGHECVRLVEAVMTSHREQRWTKVPSVTEVAV
jgi:predicted dehydrogenase